MDIQAIIAQISAALADAPEKIKDFVSDPKGTISSSQTARWNDVPTSASGGTASGCPPVK